MTSGCPAPDQVWVGSFSFGIPTSAGLVASTDRTRGSQSTARRATRVAVLRGLRGGGGRADGCYAPTAIRRSGEHVEPRRRHAICGCSTPDPVAARRVIAAVMTWPKGPSQWIAGSARPLGRMLLDRDIVPAQLVGSYVGAAPHPGG